jgi:nucleoid-associated protein YgaU
MQTHSTAASPDPAQLLAQLLAEPAPTPAVRPATTRAPWAAPVRLAPVVCATSSGRPAWRAPRASARPLAAAATLLLVGGIVAGSVGTLPATAAVASRPAAAPAAAVAAPAAGALGGMRVAPAAPEGALLARLLAGPTADDAALLARMLEDAPAAAAAALPAFELASAPAAAPAAPAAVSFRTTAALPRAAFVYDYSAVALPALTLDAQRTVPPPAPPVPQQGQQQQPPAPPGYVQPPGYQDGVPFGGQIGAVPGSRPGAPAPSRPGATRPPATATVYVVRAGDTLSTIAVRFYGDARFAATIWEVNYRVIGANPNAIFPGQRLTLPAVGSRPSVVAPAPLPARGPIAQRSTYTIQPRDFLRWMSARAYGNERFWPEIYHANRNVLGPNPDLIYPGVRVYIP